MTFKELLDFQRGKDWKVPYKRILAIDPGETCGYAKFFDGEPTIVDQCKDITEVIFEHPSPSLIAYEDYRIYPGKLRQHSFSEVPTLKVIGAIEYICKQRNIKAIPILASTAKGFVTNKRLKEWGFYQKGLRHGMDALRLGLHVLLFSKEI